MTHFDQLKAAFSKNRLGHAYIFWGPQLKDLHPGLLNFTNFILKTEQVTNNPNLNFIDAGSSDIGIDRIRNLNREKSKKSFSEGAQITIINQAQKMTTQAANALLKLLEEPRENQYLFLTAPSITSVLPTISSRCQSFSLENLEDTEKPDLDKPSLTLFEAISTAQRTGCAKLLQEHMATLDDLPKIIDALTDRIILEVNATAPHSKLKRLRKQLMALVEVQALLSSNVNLKLITEKLIFELWPSRN